MRGSKHSPSLYIYLWSQQHESMEPTFLVSTVQVGGGDGGGNIFLPLRANKS